MNTDEQTYQALADILATAESVPEAADRVGREYEVRLANQSSRQPHYAAHLLKLLQGGELDESLTARERELFRSFFVRMQALGEDVRLQLERLS